MSVLKPMVLRIPILRTPHMIVFEKWYSANLENKQDATWESWQTPRHENSMKTQCRTCYRNCKKRGMYRGKHDKTSRNYRARPLYSRICRIPCELRRLPSTLEITTMPCPILLWGIVYYTAPRKIVRLGLLKMKGSDSILKFWPLSVSFYPSKRP